MDDWSANLWPRVPSTPSPKIKGVLLEPSSSLLFERVSMQGVEMFPDPQLYLARAHQYLSEFGLLINDEIVRADLHSLQSSLTSG